jgi:hypothetical protein
MVSFATVNKESEVAFHDFMRTKMELEKDKIASEKRHYIIFLIEKRPVVTSPMKSLNSSKNCEGYSNSYFVALL